jgi:hypothetical protein
MNTLITGRSRRTILFPAQQNNPLNFNTVHGNNISLQIHFFFLKYRIIPPATAAIDDKASLHVMYTLLPTTAIKNQDHC